MTGGILDEFRFFFSGANKDIVPEFLRCKDIHYLLDEDTLHLHYSECLDEDPANGEYLYNVIRTNFLMKDFKSSLNLSKKYLMLNNPDRIYNKPKVLIISIKILSDVYQKFDEAIVLVGDLLSIIDTDFSKSQNNKGFESFYKDHLNKIALEIYIM